MLGYPEQSGIQACIESQYAKDDPKAEGKDDDQQGGYNGDHHKGK